MTLEEMLQDREIGTMVCKPLEIRGLLEKAERKLNDAGQQGLSGETRLELAYTVILTCATVYLRASGYRVLALTKRHYLTIKTMRFTGNFSKSKVAYYQRLRQKRNDDIYDVISDISDSMASEAVAEARKLLKKTISWLDEKHPELLS